MGHNETKKVDVFSWVLWRHSNKLGMVSGCLVNIIVLMLILSFQINIIVDSNTKAVYDTGIAALIVILLISGIGIRPIRMTIGFIGLFGIFLCVGILLDDLLRWSYMILPFSFGFLLRTKYNERIKSLLYFLVLVNLIIIVCQISGTNQMVYLYQTYWRYDDIVNLLGNGVDSDTVSGIQMRPPGIFPSTVYLAAFQIFLATYFFLNNVHVGRPCCFLLGMFFVATGSNTSQLLALIIFLFGPNRESSRWFFYYFVFGMILYFVLLPPFFFINNYDPFSIIRTFYGRLVGHPTYGFHGAFLKAPLVIIGIATGLGFYFVFSKKYKFGLRKLILFFSLNFGLLMLHDLLKSVWYWFYMGYLYGYIYSNRLEYFGKKRMRRHRNSFLAKSDWLFGRKGRPGLVRRGV